MAYASTYDESAFGGGGGDGELIKLLVGSRARRSRLRRLLLAKLIRDSRSEETGTDEDYDDESEDDDSPNLARLLIGRGMRRRRLRNCIPEDIPGATPERDASHVRCTPIEKINLDQSTRLLQLVPSEKPSVKKCASILETLL
jgi:hypothetical protein